MGTVKIWESRRASLVELARVVLLPELRGGEPVFRFITDGNGPEALHLAEGVHALDDPLGLLIVMANHAASVGTYTSVGKSAVWAPGGALLAQAEGMEHCLVIATRRDAAWSGEVVTI